MMSSLKINVLWNVIRVGANMLFPIITLPYINRVLGPYNIGLYNYIFSIVSYFVLFSSLGFPLHGTREVARWRDRKEELEKRINSIFSANVVSSIIVLVAFLLYSRFIFNDNYSLCLILGSSILLSSISFEWFFQGIEEFRYITIRSLIFKAFSVACLFLFVKDRNDLLIYAVINIVAVFGSNIVNCWKLNQYVKLRFNLKDFWTDVRGASVLFVGSIIASLYTHINAVMLGALGSVVAVAYYATGDKFIQMCLQVLNAFSTALIPRISYLKNNNVDKSKVNSLQKTVLSFIVLITLPMCVGLHVLSKEIIMIFAGKEFLPAITVLKWLSIIVVFIPISIFFSFQVLYPIGKEKYSNFCTLIAALVNIVFNFIFIPIFSFKAVVASIILSEGIVVVMHYYFSRKYIDVKIVDLLKYKIIIASLLAGCVAYVIGFDNIFLSCVTKVLVLVIVYISCLYLLKEEAFLELIKIVIKK